jgi:natural product precursor
MKVKKFNKKLGLNKSTVANLNNSDMNAVYGGVTNEPTVCVTKCATNCCLETMKLTRCINCSLTRATECFC